MDATQVSQITRAHLEEGMNECRWCFAVDMERVKAKKIAQHDFPDAIVIHLKCPRCGGESSYYIRIWGEDYIRNVLLTLHPELETGIKDSLIREINDRVWPEFDHYC